MSPQTPDTFLPHNSESLFTAGTESKPSQSLTVRSTLSTQGEPSSLLVTGPRVPFRGARRHFKQDEWDEIWTAIESAWVTERIIILHDPDEPSMWDLCGYEALSRPVRLLNELWVANAEGFGRNMKSKSQGTNLQLWFRGDSSAFDDLLLASRINFITNDLTALRDRTSWSMSHKEQTTLSAQQQDEIIQRRQRQIMFFRSDGRSRGRKFLQHMIQEFYLPADSGSLLSDEDERAIGERLRYIRRCFVEGFHYWRNYNIVI
jgi:hypothetical protein